MKNETSWDNYCELIKELSGKINANLSDNNFDQIVCCAKSGMIVGEALSRIFNIPLAILFPSSYAIAKNTSNTLNEHIAKQNNIIGKRILVVDDMTNTGNTLKNIVQQIDLEYNPEVLKTAVIWRNTTSEIYPDYFVRFATPGECIIKPFQFFDNLNIHGK